MLPKLQVPNNFKPKVFFGDQILKETFALDKKISYDVPEFSHMGEQKNTKTLNWQLLHLEIPLNFLNVLKTLTLLLLKMCMLLKF